MDCVSTAIGLNFFLRSSFSSRCFSFSWLSFLFSSWSLKGYKWRYFYASWANVFPIFVACRVSAIRTKYFFPYVAISNIVIFAIKMTSTAVFTLASSCTHDTRSNYSIHIHSCNHHKNIYHNFHILRAIWIPCIPFWDNFHVNTLMLRLGPRSIVFHILQYAVI